MPAYMPSLTTLKTLHSFSLYEASVITYADELLSTADHTYTGWKINAAAGEDVDFPNLCYLKNDGKFWKTDADAAGTTEGLLAVAVAIVAGGRYEYYHLGYTIDLAAYGNRWIAQTFTPSVAHTITSVKLLIRRVLLPGTITVSIRETDAISGHPTGADLCSGTTDGDTLTDTWPGEWREITLGAGYDLDADTKYAIVVRALTGDGTNRLLWQGDIAGIYVGGNYESSGNAGVVWASDVANDCVFEEWGVAIAPPTGFLLRGFIRDDSWTWTVGGTIYVSLTPGEFTQTAPTVSGDQVRKVGVAISADVMWFNPDATVTGIP